MTNFIYTLEDVIFNNLDIKCFKYNLITVSTITFFFISDYFYAIKYNKFKNFLNQVKYYKQNCITSFRAYIYSLLTK